MKQGGEGLTGGTVLADERGKKKKWEKEQDEMGMYSVVLVPAMNTATRKGFGPKLQPLISLYIRFVKTCSCFCKGCGQHSSHQNLDISLEMIVNEDH